MSSTTRSSEAALRELGSAGDGHDASGVVEEPGGLRRPADSYRTSSVGSPRSRVLGSALSDLAAVIRYFAVEAAVGNVTASLALAGSLPALWTLVAWKRWGQLDPLALASVCLFALAIAISVLTGGSALPLKLTKASLTGIVGLVALISAAVRRPLIGVVVETVSSRRRLPVGSREGQCRQRTYRIATVIVGLTAVVDAAAQFVLASTLSTGSFLVVGSIVRWTILVIGGATTVRYLRRGPADGHR